MSRRRSISTPLPNGPPATIRVKRIQRKTWTQKVQQGVAAYQRKYVPGQEWSGDRFQIECEAVYKSKTGRWVRIPGTTANWKFAYGGVEERSKALVKAEVDFVRVKLIAKIEKMKRDLQLMELALAHSEREVVVIDKVHITRGCYDHEPDATMIKPTRLVSLVTVDTEPWGLPDGPVDPRGRWATDSPPLLPEQVGHYGTRDLAEFEQFREDE